MTWRFHAGAKSQLFAYHGGSKGIIPSRGYTTYRPSTNENMTFRAVSPSCQTYSSITVTRLWFATFHGVFVVVGEIFRHLIRLSTFFWRWWKVWVKDQCRDKYYLKIYCDLWIFLFAINYLSSYCTGRFSYSIYWDLLEVYCIQAFHVVSSTEYHRIFFQFCWSHSEHALCFLAYHLIEFVRIVSIRHNDHSEYQLHQVWFNNEIRVSST